MTATVRNYITIDCLIVCIRIVVLDTWIAVISLVTVMTLFVTRVRGHVIVYFVWTLTKETLLGITIVLNSSTTETLILNTHELSGLYQAV